jgi:hypothetical protein
VVTREELYHLVWAEPMSKLAERFEVSGSYLARICTILDVPRPERGYWAKLAVGKAPERPTLPQADAGTLLYWSQTGEQMPVPKPKAPSSRQPKPKIRIARDRIHPLVIGAATHFESGRPVDQGSYLKPYKKMLVDVTAAEATLKVALDLANELFNAIEVAGHRVMLAPSNQQLRRISAEEREPVGQARQYWDHSGLWSPDRATIAFIGTVAVGLQIVEMSESVTMRYVRGKYIRETDYVAPKRGYQGDTFTTTRAMPSGRLRVIAYSPYSDVEWSARWQDTAKSAVRTSVRTIVAALIAKAPDLVLKLEEADRQRQIRHQEWLVQEDRRQREDDRRRISESVLESTADLRKIIERWADMTSIGRFLDGIEKSTATLSDDDKQAVLQRLALARTFLGVQDPLDFFRGWQTPEERYSPRFSESLTGL